MDRRQFLAGAAAVGGATLLAGQAKADPITFKLGTNDSPELPTGHGVRAFASEVERLTGGAIKVAIFDASALGINTTQIQNVIVGAQDMHLLYSQYLGNFVDQVKVVAAPYLFRSLDHMQAYYKSALFKPAVDKLRATGAEILDPDWTWRVNDPQGLLSKTAVFTPADIANMKIRVFEDNTTIEMWKGLGASTVLVPRGQVYLALTQGLIAASPELIGVAYDLKDVEVAKYWTRTDTNYNILNILMNEARYQALTDQQRQALKQAVQTAGAAFAAETLRGFNEKMDKSREQGVNIIEPNPAPWRDKGKDVLAALVAKGIVPKDLIAPIQAL